jgi:hypothetical protein
MGKFWSVSQYLGTDISYTTDSVLTHGVRINNFDSANPLTFTLSNGVGEMTLQPNQQYFDLFKTPFTTVTINNPSGCKFLVERIEP